MKRQKAELLEGILSNAGFLEEAGAGFVFLSPGEIGPSAGRQEPVSPADSAAARKAAHVPSSPSPPAEAFREIEERIRSCRLCPLHRMRTQAVPGEGNPSASLMFVGEAPGRDEDRQGRPFVGRAGQLLRRIIAAMKFREEEVYITNVVKCRPPENRTPHRDEVAACSPYLVRQIELIGPQVIVTLGKSPTDFFVPSRLGMTALRGTFAEYNGIPLMPTFHPSYLVRNEGNRELKRMVWDDMQKVMALLGKK